MQDDSDRQPLLGTHGEGESHPLLSADANTLQEPTVGSVAPTYGDSTDMDWTSFFSRKHLQPIFESKLAMIKQRAPYYIPILKWLPKYQLSYLKNDIMAGLTISVMIVPQGLAYSDLAYLPSTYGLHCAFIPVLAYVFLGMCPQMSVGPEALCAILTGVTLSSVHDMDEREALCSVMTFIVGSITFLFGLFRLGFIDSVLSRPLVSAFVLGSALVIMVEQLNGIFGLPPHEGPMSTLDQLQGFFKHIGDTQPYTLAFSLPSVFTLLAVYFGRMIFPNNKIIKVIPAILLVVIVAAVVSYKTNASDHGVTTLGDVPSGFFSPRLPPITMTRINKVIGPSCIMMVIGFIEASAIGKIYSSKYNYMTSPNRELVALGIANILGSFFGAFPTYASLPRSATGDMMGGKTHITGFIVFIVVLLTQAVMLPLFAPLPRGAMAAIIFYAGVSLVHFDQIKFMIRVRGYIDIAMMLFVFLVTFFVSIETGMLCGLGISVLLVVRNITLPRMTILGRVTGTDKFLNVSDHPEVRRADGLLIVRIEQPLHFANTGQLKDLLWRIELHGDTTAHPSLPPLMPPLAAVIFDLADMVSIDPSAALIFSEIITSYRSRNVLVCLVHLRSENKRIFFRSGLVDLVEPSHIFGTLNDAQRYVEGQGQEGNFSTYDLSMDSAVTL